MKVMIVGAGKLGRKLASTLTDTNFDVTVVDESAKVISMVKDHLDVLTVQANGVEIFSMQELKIDTYEFLVSVTNSDETNAIISSLGKRQGIKNTIARIRNPEYLEQLNFIKQEMDIDYVLNPDLAVANEITRYLQEDYHMYSGTFAGGKVHVVKYRASRMKGYVGKQIKQLYMQENILIASIMRNDEVIIPNGETYIEEDDIIYFSGHRKNINDLAKETEEDIRKKTVRKIMIMGGGNIGLYAAKKLSESNILVTLVEENWERCKYLSAKLPDVIVIHGDGTDMHLLEEENLKSMDVFFSATGMDETNIIMALSAKHEGVNKAIAKLSRPNYASLIAKLGVDVALNITNISAGEILKFIHGDKVANISLMMDGKAELTEVIITADSDVVGHKLADLNLHDDIMVTALTRQDDVIIPKGDTVIKAGDRLLVLFFLEHGHKLDIFLRNKKGGFFHEIKNRSKGIR